MKVNERLVVSEIIAPRYKAWTNATHAKEQVPASVDPDERMPITFWVEWLERLDNLWE